MSAIRTILLKAQTNLHPLLLQRAPLLWLLLPLALGYTWAGWLEEGIPYGLWLSALLCAGALVALKHLNKLAVPLAATALIPVAALHHLAANPPHTAWIVLPPREADLVVLVTDLQPGSLPRLAGFGRVLEASQSVSELRGMRIHFNAAAHEKQLAKGDVALVRGVLMPLDSAPHAEGFDRHLAASGARFKLVRAILLEIRPGPAGGLQNLGRALNAGMAGLLRLGLEHHPELADHYLALKLGAKSGLSDEQKQAYRRTGTLHLFAISGMNIGVVALSVHVALRLFRVGRKSASTLGVFGASLFVLATGASASASRALLMLLALHAAVLLNRHATPLAVWTAAALAVLIFEPGALFASGFQLSFSVVLGLILYAGPLDIAWEGSGRSYDFEPAPEGTPLRKLTTLAIASLRTGLCASFAATVCSLPACISNFGGFSIGAVLANILLVPLASLVVVSGLCALAAGGAGFVSVCALFNHAAALSLVAMDGIARACARLPGLYWMAEWRFEGAGAVSTLLILGSVFAGACARWERPIWLLAPPAIAVACVACFAQVSAG